MSKIKNTLIKLTKQPVVQFMCIGLLMFLINTFVVKAGDNNEEDKYKVYLSRSEVKSMEEIWLSKWQRPPTEMELEGMVNQYIEKAILFKEAVKIGLNKNDNIIRQRLAQKLEFLSNDLVKPDSATADEVQEYFELNIEKYTTPEKVTVTQLYVNHKIHGDSLDNEVKSRLSKLNSLNASSTNINIYGDQFTLQTYFPDIPKIELAKLFGREFVANVFELETEKWIGPVNSQYGAHLVYISHKSPAIVPEFETVTILVTEDLQRKKQIELNNLYIDGILSRYEVIIEEKEEK